MSRTCASSVLNALNQQDFNLLIFAIANELTSFVNQSAKDVHNEMCSRQPKVMLEFITHKKLLSHRKKRPLALVYVIRIRVIPLDLPNVKEVTCSLKL